MTRATGTRSSKRKPGKTSQEIIPEDFKQISPSILSQSSAKRTLSQNTRSAVMKENISPKEPSRRPLKSMSVHKKEVYSPVRKSVRHQKSSSSVQDAVLKNISERNVLCDKTNSLKTRGKDIKKKNIEIIQTIENKKNTVYKIISVPDPNLSNSVQEDSSDENKIGKETHVPIYKNKGLLDIGSESTALPENKNEGVYEFEVDENEEPIQKKRRKKRVNPRKPKIGPKALTINNIKYSSTESLVSLPEKPIAHKKRPTKGAKDNLKRCPSMVTLNDNEDTCYSVKSFMSHPPSLVSRENKNFKSKHQLSVLQETQSEQCASPVNIDLINERLPDNNLGSTTPLNISVNSKKNSNPSTSVLSNFSPNPRCYVSKTSNKTNSNLSRHSEAYQKSANDTLPLQLSSCSANVSVISNHDFLSSTPCKRSSLVVRNNSVFDDSCDLPHGMRLSTGFIKDASVSASASVDHCFGFDEPEELEEPLVSPIKASIDLVPRKPVKLLSWKTEPNQVDIPKPSTQEVIQMLKASILKAATKQTSDVFDISNHQCSSPTLTEECSEVAVSFVKPPRRSYERQRRVRYYSEHEEEEDNESGKENNVEEEKENVPKVVKNCYKKKGNTTKTTKPRVTKSKQRAAKEEEELERLAAQMNAQFQQIEKMNLVVE
ncbi:hypothetical protein J6590_055570 [Homalodisca vitripennis]|nr:hypothetical protein J6590_055570 [Homalodisca vitripennis]